MASIAPPQPGAPKWRSVAAAIGLGAGVVDGLVYAALAAYAIGTGTFATNFRPVLFWFRVGVWLGVFAIVTSGLGQGRLRKWGLIVGLVTFLLWLFRGHR